MRRQGEDIERWVREMAPLELGIVAVERQESTAAFYIYYTIAEPEEHIRKHGNTWYRMLWAVPEPPGGDTDWDSFVHLKDGAADHYMEKQLAIYEFLEHWANGRCVGADFLKHIYKGLGFESQDGIFCLRAEEILERNNLAREFLQNHLLHASARG